MTNILISCSRDHLESKTKVLHSRLNTKQAKNINRILFFMENALNYPALNTAEIKQVAGL